MALLKKIRGSTLMETMVATVLIVVIFMMASMILNHLFANSLRQNTHDIEYRLGQLQYRYQNKKLILPYYEEKKDWSIEVSELEWAGKVTIVFTAKNAITKQEVTYGVAHE